MLHRYDLGIGKEASFWLSVVISLAIFFVPDIKAQSGGCGTEVTPRSARLIFENSQSLDAYKSQRSSAHYSIPVAIHIVRQSNGTGGFDPAEVAPSFDSANILFQPANLDIFLYQPVDFIDNDYLYNDQSSSTTRDSLKRCSVAGEAVNVYLVPNSSNFGLCGLSSFPMSGTQGIILNNICAGSALNNTVIVHEIGHYFNLMHTHETVFGVECPNENNCATTGDLLCDTPADPNVYTHVTSAPACVYDNFASPPGGCDATPYNPPIHNIMSYSAKSCSVLFTPQQIQRFRSALETLRPELGTLTNGIKVTPAGINPLSVPLGSTQDTTILVKNSSNTMQTIQSATSQFGHLTITSGVPATLNPSASTNIVVEYDASALHSTCDMQELVDTLIINISSPTVFSIKVPIIVDIAFSKPTQPMSSFGPSCFHFSAPNTPALGGQSGNDLVNNYGNLLYDGSLLLGTVDGVDTTVYMDVFTQTDFLRADHFIPGTDTFGRKTETLRFATKDGRLNGTVIYKFGANTAGIDSCRAFEIEYRIRNDCDTTLKLAAGIVGDFDIIDPGSNNATVVPASNLIYDEYGGLITGFVNLQPCQVDRGLQAISNSAEIYPTGSLPDGSAYQLLTQGNSGNLTTQDVSLLLSFGKIELPPGAERRFYAGVVSADALPLLMTVVNTLKAVHNPAACYLDVPGDFATIQSAINAASDADTVLLNPGTYTGTGNVNLDFLGKKVSIRGLSGAAATIIDCGGSVLTPKRAFRFDNNLEDSNIVIDGLTIRHGYAPADGSGGNPWGGAALITAGARPRFRNCIFTQNTASRSGGAIAIESGSTIILENCQFSSNSAITDWGGAVWMASGPTSRISNCTFSSNSANTGGAVAFDNGSNPIVTGCRFTSNHAVFGGVMVVDDANPTVSYCILDHNYATSGVSAVIISNGPSNVNFSNCTMFRNYVTPPAPGLGGVFYIDNATATLQRCLFAFNDSDQVLICASGGSYSISCSDMFGNSSGNWTGCVASQNGSSGNFSANPMFCDTAAGSFRVASSSPCAAAHNSCNMLIGAGNGACGNTPAGSGIAVQVTDSVSVTFANVTVDGETSVTNSPTGPMPPSGYQVVPSDPTRYYQISTTAPHSGTITICIKYDPSQVVGGSESDLKILHHNGSSWDNVTTSIDSVNNMICCQTSTLSPFIVALPTYLCGDADGSHFRNISDAVYLIKYIFSGGPSPVPTEAGDADCNQIVNISDAVYLVNYIFSGGPAPCAACP